MLYPEIDEFNGAGFIGDIKKLKLYRKQDSLKFYKWSCCALEQCYYGSSNEKRKHKVIKWLFKHGNCDLNYIQSYVGLKNLKKYFHIIPKVNFINHYTEDDIKLSDSATNIILLHCKGYNIIDDVIMKWALKYCNYNSIHNEIGLNAIAEYL